MEKIVISLIFSSLLAALAIYKKSLTYKATIVAWICSVIITYCGGIISFVILTLTFLMTVLADKLMSGKRKKIVESINEKHGKRDVVQVLANVLIATISLIIFHFSNDFIYLILYASVMASSLSDSMASEIGILSRGKTFSITTFEQVKPGLSGGISLLGLIASMTASVLVSLLFVFATKSNVNVFIFIAISGFLGSIIDSYLGGTLQVKYKCIKCNKITEKTSHCRNKTKYFKGIKLINNDIVNIINNLVVFLLGLAILLNITI